MRIALVGAEFEENLAVRYLWSALERDGHEVVQVVFNGPEEVDRAAAEVAGSRADIAGLSMVFTYRAREFAALAARARLLGFAGHLVAGGHFAAFHPEQLLDAVPALDSIACGEGEAILCDLARHSGDPAAVAGLVWRGPAGLVRNPPAAKPVDLDALAPPTHKAPPDRFLGLPIVNLLSSRGCTHACGFCSIAAWHRLCGGPRVRYRDPARVVDEMASLHRRGARIFNFHDDNFLPRGREEALARADAFAAEVERRHLGRLAFAIKARPDSVDEEVFARLRSAGLFRVFLGIEAGTAESLRHLGRGQTVEDNERALEIVDRLDLHTCFNLLLLNPDSTLEDMAANVAFLRRHPHNPMNFCRTEIYAGTPLEARLRRAGRLESDFWSYTYTIADPRAQAAFALMTPAFEARNYGERGLHHMAMAVDYEHQILAHFHGGDEELRRRVKGFIVAVNHDTCDHLERLISEAERAPVGDDLEETARRLTRDVQAANRRLLGCGDALLDEMRGREPESRADRPWLRTAAAAGLLASVTFSAGDAAARPAEPTLDGVLLADATIPKGKPPKTKPPKPAEPLPPPHTHMYEMVAEPPPPPVPMEELAKAPLAPPALARPLLGPRLPALARQVPRGEALEVELWIDGTGHVARAIVRTRNVPPAGLQAMSDALSSLYSVDTRLRGRRVVVSYTAAEVDGARPPRIVTQPTELVAPPPPRPPTHMFEKAPRPPLPPPTHFSEEAPPPPPPPPPPEKPKK